jgi:hypothetical protein
MTNLSSPPPVSNSNFDVRVASREFHPVRWIVFVMIVPESPSGQNLGQSILIQGRSCIGKGEAPDCDEGLGNLKLVNEPDLQALAVWDLEDITADVITASMGHEGPQMLHLHRYTGGPGHDPQSWHRSIIRTSILAHEG